MRTAVRLFAACYFVLMAIAVTFPGVRPFNTVYPLVLGLPFSFAWVVGWVIGAGIVFFLVYLAENRR
ncbi:hypothetical protein HRbin33_02154 [bacterium HR33]|nr:hypothetical protein HRbin33_02154 [bacterium HR33]